MKDEKAEQARLDSKARRVAKRAGFIARKSRSAYSSWNRGGYMLVDTNTGNIIAGAYFELSAEDVIAFCEA